MSKFERIGVIEKYLENLSSELKLMKKSVDEQKDQGAQIQKLQAQFDRLNLALSKQSTGNDSAQIVAQNLNRENALLNEFNSLKEVVEKQKVELEMLQKQMKQVQFYNQYNDKVKKEFETPTQTGN